MANTTYTDKVGPAINAGWLNDVNFVIYFLLGDGTNIPDTRDQLLANLGSGVVGGGNTNFQQELAPLTPTIGDLWQVPSTGLISRWNGSAWIPFADIAQGLATSAQSTANIALTNAATAEAQAVAANTAALSAQTNASIALAQLTNIGSDNILSQVEKPAVILDYTRVTAEQADIDAKASLYAITSQKTNYDSSITALGAYLSGLTSPTVWNDTTGDTNIIGTVFRTTWATVYTARQLLLNEISRVAGTVATWAGVSGVDVTTTQIHAQAATEIDVDTFDFGGTAFGNGVQRTVTITPVVNCTVLFNATIGATNINGDSGSHVTWYVTPAGGTKTIVVDTGAGGGSARATYPMVNVFSAVGGVPLVFTLETLKGGFTSVNLYLSTATFTLSKR